MNKYIVSKHESVNVIELGVIYCKEVERIK